MQGDLSVTTTGTGNGSVSVSAGEIVVAHTTTGQGYYFAVNDAATTVGSFAANSSGNPRIDLVTVLVTDTGGTPVVAFSIVQGTPASTPVAPTPPASSTAHYVTLAQVTIPNGFTVSTTVAAGNIVDVRPKAFLPDLSVQGVASTTVPSPTHGNLAYHSLDQRLVNYNANAVEGARWENVAERTGFRNVVINGKMDIAQRGTSVTGNTTGGYTTVDRFALGLSSLGTLTITQTADAPTGTDFRNCKKIQCTTANASPSAGSFMQITQGLEGQDLQHFRKGTANGKPFTLSFWVKAFQTGTFIVELLDNTNSRSISASYTINSSGTWQYVAVTFPADTTGQFANDNTAALYVNWWLGAGSTYSSGTLQTAWGTTTNANRAVGQTNLASSTSNYFQLTGVQLEAGSVPSQFERRPYGTELALCQRYYIAIINREGAFDSPLGQGNWHTANTLWCYIPFVVDMRINPTQTTDSGSFTAYGGGGSSAISAITLYKSGREGAEIQVTTGGSPTLGTGGWFTSATVGAGIRFNAEL
jgi:hypothetical protein